MGYEGHVTEYLRALDAQTSSQNRNILLFMLLIPKTSYLKDMQVMFLSINSTSSIQIGNNQTIKTLLPWYYMFNLNQPFRNRIYIVCMPFPVVYQSLWTVFSPLFIRSGFFAAAVLWHSDQFCILSYALYFCFSSNVWIVTEQQQCKRFCSFLL